MTLRKMKFASIVASLSVLFLASSVVSAQTSSPFPPPEEDLGIYVVNSGTGLDTGCTYRSGGPLMIQLDVPATMNPSVLNSDGTIKQDKLAQLIQNKVIGSTAKISFPTYDIDSAASVSGIQPEVDAIYFNGKSYGTLTGQNNQWLNDSFPVDISEVKFNTSNEIRIDIDTANSDGEYWCMSVDWVAIEFEAAAPYVLAHGISAQRDTWEAASSPGVLQAMNESGVLYERFSVEANGSVAANAQNLKGQVKNFLDNVKAKKVNIIAHSKGGLDSQAMAKISGPDFEVLSLSTLSTPHRGSVVADLQLLQRQAIDVYVNQAADPNGYAQQFVSLSLAGLASRLGAGPQPPGLNDLTTQAAAAAIIAGLRGNVANTFTVAADAGPQCSRSPTDIEISPMADSAPFGTQGYTNDALRLAYRAICSYSSARQLNVTTQVYATGMQPVVITTLTYETVTASSSNPNDIVVGVSSAHPGWGTAITTNSNTNHSEVKNPQNINQLLNKTIELR
ncbi:alpha/beta hydrolase [Paraglaciecola sp.]|uniref:esterase/lipase family protein n=1 Tax=Paraglaciecola sp. TaxID=1920173 RepID=UPI0030F38546